MISNEAKVLIVFERFNKLFFVSGVPNLIEFLGIGLFVIFGVARWSSLIANLHHFEYFLVFVYLILVQIL